MKDKFNAESLKFIEALKIAIESFKEYPPSGFNEEALKYALHIFENSLQTWINPKPQYQNLSSLNMDKNETLSYFYEADGQTVDYFWKRVKEKGIPYFKEKKLEKILKAKRIKNQSEHDYVIDVMTPMFQEGILSKEDYKLLSHYIGEFESNQTEKSK